jgi:glycosyltransferase involved in cell wall biosynthesis
VPETDATVVKRVAFLASGDPRDRAAQSGSLYHMVCALKAELDHLHLCEPITSLPKHSGRLADAVSRRLLRRRIAYDHLAVVARRHGRIGAARVRRTPCDAIVAVMNLVDVACLQADVPIVLVLDATFALQRDYYPQFSDLWAWSARQAEQVERAAYRNASSLAFSSRWAARSAVEDYGVDPQKVHVIPYGANLDSIPPRDGVLRKAPSPACRLLLVGVGWKEKGGPIALEALKQLEAIGIEAELTVCGSTPPRGTAHPRMRVIPFLDKRDGRQRRQLEQLYATSDFLLLPTRRDATPHVLCEASAFGLPSITSDTGAVRELVRDGENGYVLPYDAAGRDYARIIADIHRDQARYAALAASSRDAYEARLSWEVWARALGRVLANASVPPSRTASARAGRSRAP